jgi:hypothetical protein
MVPPMPTFNGTDFDISKEQRRHHNELENEQVAEINEETRDCVCREMPDLVSKLPSRLTR